MASKDSENASKASEIKSTQEADRAKSEADRAKGYAEQASTGQVPADWNQTDSTQKDYIKNKPTIPTKVSQLNNDLGYLTKDISEVISAPGASFTGDVSATTVNATSLDVTGQSNLGVTGIRDAGFLFSEAAPYKGLGISADMTDDTYGGIVSIRNVNDPYNPGGISFYTRTPKSGINTNHIMEFRNDGSLHIDNNSLAYISKMWKNGSSWYRKWSDGWIEQGGEFTKQRDTNITVTFPVAFQNTNYTIATSQYVNLSSDAPGGAFTSKLTTGITHNYGSCGSKWGWYACGY